MYPDDTKLFIYWKFDKKDGLIEERNCFVCSSSFLLCKINRMSFVVMVVVDVGALDVGVVVFVGVVAPLVVLEFASFDKTFFCTLQ